MSSRPGPKMKEPTHDQVYQFVREHSRPFVTSREVAEEFPSVARRTINGRLNELHDRGRIAKREIGANSVVWYLQREPLESAARPASDSQ